MGVTECKDMGKTMKSTNYVNTFKDLKVYKNAFESAMEIFQMTKAFPAEEKYSLVDQIRRSSRSVCANIAEAWRKRRYEAAFIAKLSDAETEACEIQVWLQFSCACGYIDKEKMSLLEDKYEHMMSQLVLMINESNKWIIKESPVRRNAESPVQQR